MVRVLSKTDQGVMGGQEDEQMVLDKILSVLMLYGGGEDEVI